MFLLLHLRKHFMNYGVGFRQFMDVAVVVKNCPIDWDAFGSAVEQLKIKDFAAVCFAFIRKWFGVEAPFPAAEIPDDFCLRATERIFAGGVFGFNDDANRENYTIVQLQKNKGRKLKLLLSSLFPSYASMSSVPKYAFLKGKPLLLPAAWLYRAAVSLKQGTARHRVNEVQRHLSVSGAEVADRSAYLNEWGLSVNERPEE